MKNRELSTIKNDLKIITSNKLNSSQSKLLLIGIIFEIIQRRDLFPKNSDLKMFVNQVFVAPMSIKPFKDYLFLSRTLLGSRIGKIILFDFEYKNVIKTVETLRNLLPGKEDKEKNISSSKWNDDGMNEWINFIRGNVK
ncbi:hypothetical protein NSQ61_17965 [Aeribacillus sp. FSL K6-1121]|uniref:hypothetical protein n=1 Tax=Aeribacillus sp. FSL K6-1121 TaxID=2954745 RepID=UPI0030FB665F